jgi:hypothetical protein
LIIRRPFRSFAGRTGAPAFILECLKSSNCSSPVGWISDFFAGQEVTLRATPIDSKNQVFAL